MNRRMTYCGATAAAGVDALPDGRIFVAGITPCVEIMDARGKSIWTIKSPVLDVRDQSDIMRVSEDGKVVDFGYVGQAGPVLRFDVRSFTLSRSSPSDGLTFAPNRKGLKLSVHSPAFPT